MRNVRATGPVLYQNTNGGSALRGSVGDLVASINNGASIRNVITKLGVAAWMDSVQVVLNIPSAMLYVRFYFYLNVYQRSKNTSGSN